MNETNEKLGRQLKDLDDRIAITTRNFRESMATWVRDHDKATSKLRTQIEDLEKDYKTATEGIKRSFSDAMRDIVKVVKKLHEDRDIPVLIEGETGTGKEIIVRMIHYGNLKDSRPFVTVNCSAISPNLFESELFGYESGAFTGARQKGMMGKLELAHGGTLFLDEIGDMPLDMQPKLLRVLQQKEIYRIGGTKKIKLDVRLQTARII